MLPSLFNWLDALTENSAALGNLAGLFSWFFTGLPFTMMVIVLVYLLSGLKRNFVMGASTIVTLSLACYLFADAAAWRTDSQLTPLDLAIPFAATIVSTVVTWNLGER